MKDDMRAELLVAIQVTLPFFIKKPKIKTMPYFKASLIQDIGPVVR